MQKSLSFLPGQHIHRAKNIGRFSHGNARLFILERVPWPGYSEGRRGKVNERNGASQPIFDGLQTGVSGLQLALANTCLTQRQAAPKIGALHQQ